MPVPSPQIGNTQARPTSNLQAPVPAQAPPPDPLTQIAQQLGMPPEQLQQILPLLLMLMQGGGGAAPQGMGAPQPGAAPQMPAPPMMGPRGP